jgi:hypothetical protein
VPPGSDKQTKKTVASGILSRLEHVLSITNYRRFYGYNSHSGMQKYNLLFPIQSIPENATIVVFDKPGGDNGSFIS